MNQRRKPTCLFCEDKSIAAPLNLLATTGGDGWKLYFCSQKCALKQAERDASLTNEWCEVHRRWFHPDDNCHLCERDA